MEDHLANLLLDTREDKTKLLFYTWNNFKVKINCMFGDIDEEHTAERALAVLS
jgi:hypothetical protein